MNAPTRVPLPPNMPSRMRQLPRDEVGRPVPFFVATVDGKPDFRLMDDRALVTAVQEQLCFLCGERLNRARRGGPRGTFVVGPMCVVNRISAEPPNHRDCAAWAVKACPFLTKPLRERRESNLPEDVKNAAGFMIERNPGVTALVDSEKWRVIQADMGGHGVLFQFGDITSIDWSCEGRPATVPEVLWSVETGLPALTDMAAMDGGMGYLAIKMRTALRWFGARDLITEADYPNISAVLRELP